MKNKSTVNYTSNQPDISHAVSIPSFAISSFSRSNLPAVIHGSLSYQQHPVSLTIDGVAELHHAFFTGLDIIDCAETRTLHFHQYMCAAFLLGKSEQAGLTENTCVRRYKLDYLRLLRGWMFNSDSIEGAVIKRWVESRFGLLTLNHGGSIKDQAVYNRYHADFVSGLYNTNALESQLDLLYSFCQYELTRRWPEQTHCLLYRGVNNIDEFIKLEKINCKQSLLLLNNLNSFSDDRESSETFGDYIIESRVPVTKLFYFPELLTGVLKGELEYIVLGGIYKVEINYF